MAILSHATNGGQNFSGGVGAEGVLVSVEAEVEGDEDEDAGVGVGVGAGAFVRLSKDDLGYGGSIGIG